MGKSIRMWASLLSSWLEHSRKLEGLPKGLEEYWELSVLGWDWKLTGFFRVHKRRTLLWGAHVHIGNPNSSWDILFNFFRGEPSHDFSLEFRLAWLWALLQVVMEEDPLSSKGLLANPAGSSSGPATWVPSLPDAFLEGAAALGRALPHLLPDALLWSLLCSSSSLFNGASKS